MLKITDENGKLKFTLSEEDSEPRPVQEDKKEVIKNKDEGEDDEQGNA